jgi:hypothetical protein
MKKIILLCSVFVLMRSHTSFGQTKDNTDYNVWALSKDSSGYVFTNKAYLRSAAGTKAAILDSLDFGSRIIVSEQTDKYESIRGIYAPWVKVTSQNNGNTKEGYIWLGSLAVRKYSAAGIDYLYGIDRIEKQMKDEFESSKFVIQLKAADASGKLIDTKEFKTDGGEAANFTDVKSLGNTKLANLTDVVRISFGGEACGIPTYFYYYGFTGEKLLALPGKYTVGDAGVFYHSETLLFPNENGGQPGKIIKLIEEEEVLEEETKATKEKIKKTNSKETYLWDGQVAVKQKK